MLALVTPNVDLGTYGSEALLTLLGLASITFLLGSFLLGQTPVSYGTSEPRKRIWRGFVEKMQEVIRFRPAGRQDRRSAMRREGEPLKVFVAPGANATEAGEGLVLNRSRGGLCLVVPEPVEKGRLIRVRAAHVPEDMPWIPIHVRHCQAKGGSWRLGCQFVEKLPWSVVLVFG
jgi:hypothetical protein